MKRKPHAEALFTNLMLRREYENPEPTGPFAESYRIAAYTAAPALWPRYGGARFEQGHNLAGIRECERAIEIVAIGEEAGEAHLEALRAHAVAQLRVGRGRGVEGVAQALTEHATLISHDRALHKLAGHALRLGVQIVKPRDWAERSVF